VDPIQVAVEDFFLVAEDVVADEEEIVQRAVDELIRGLDVPRQVRVR
jgi:hypothetical protein